ncbi:MAG TPA: 6,7-dimethyl-8-ribityllumazine synthase [Candidatus Polarisedimenticolaceae bacterium]|nr:6,7-dimethyl-8-ribityllumazine synthase [Candidatus Polarisedimenticolaceae bacterium]
MARTVEGSSDAKGLKVALIVARWHEDVTSRLMDAALDALVKHGASPDDLTVVRVPGSWELPLAAAKLAAARRHDALVALGCLIRGETPHFDVLAAETAAGLGRVGASSGIPVVFGVLTCETLEQALSRAGGAAGNKGWDAALAAIEMVSLYRRLG